MGGREWAGWRFGFRSSLDHVRQDIIRPHITGLQWLRTFFKDFPTKVGYPKFKGGVAILL